MKKKDMQWDAPRGSENPENSLLNFPHNITLRNFWIRARSQTAAVASQFSKSQTRIGAWRTGEGPIIDFWRKPISVEEVLISSIVLVLLCATLVASFADYPYYTCCFHQLSAAIRHWDFGGLDPSQPKEFWGYSYLSALVASVTRLPDIFAIVLVSSSSFVVANYLCCRLWGTMVAAWLMVVNYWWMDTATEGMTDPLFMALLLGTFIAFRKERWVVAAILASAATTVRPVGIFALFAIGIVLLARRQLRQLAITTAIGLATGIVYIIPMVLIYGDPLANVAGYHKSDWSSALPLTIPLFAIIKSAAISHAFTFWSRLHIVYSSVNAAWVVFSVAGTIKMAAANVFGIMRSHIQLKRSLWEHMRCFCFRMTRPHWFFITSRASRFRFYHSCFWFFAIACRATGGSCGVSLWLT